MTELRTDPQKVHFTKVAGDPTALDDKTKGFGIDCVWLNSSTGNSFICSDNAMGAAVWLPIPNSIATARIAAAAVTPPKMSFAGFKFTTFRGKNLAGAITGLTGAVIGMRVAAALELGTAADKLLLVGAANTGAALSSSPNALFEPAITVTDQLQQVSATDLSGKVYLLILMSAAA